MELVLAIVFAVGAGIMIGWVVCDLLHPKEEAEEYFYDKDEDVWM